MTPTFDVARFESLRQSRKLALGSPLHHAAVTGSTNDDALAAARAGAPEGSTFVAEHQTKGRGRRGHAWHADPGASLLFSVILRPRIPLERVPGLALATGVAVRRALARALPDVETRRALRIKWPNDVWASGKKIAGVLAESHLEGAALRAVVLGVGVNVSASRFPEELAASATSITLEGGRADREVLLADILEALSTVVGAFDASDLAKVCAEVSHYDAIVGRKVRVDTTEGIASGIDPLGRLLVRCSGELVAVTAGTVELCDAATGS